MWITACVHVCVCVCVRGQLYLCAATVSTGRAGWWQLDRWQGWRGGGLVLHGQPWFQLNQGLTLIPALHTAAHEAERGVRQSLTEDASATLRVTCGCGFTARSARRVRVGLLISECDVAPRKPSANIRPCVKGKMDYICIPIVIFSLAEIITLKTRHNLFDSVCWRRRRRVMKCPLTINVPKQRGEIYIKHLSNDKQTRGLCPWGFFPLLWSKWWSFLDCVDPFIARPNHWVFSFYCFNAKGSSWAMTWSRLYYTCCRGSTALSLREVSKMEL